MRLGTETSVATGSEIYLRHSSLAIKKLHGRNVSRLLHRGLIGLTNDILNLLLSLGEKPKVTVAQLSQKDRAAGWVSYGQKWKTGTGRQYLRTI